MGISRRALGYSALYVGGVALFFLPTARVVGGYGLVLALIVAWCALEGFSVYRARNRVWLIATLGPMAALLIFMIVEAAKWVPTGMIA
ncbi:MAG: hypothetical protein ACOH1H_10975 [Brevundimonas sp.]